MTPWSHLYRKMHLRIKVICTADDSECVIWAKLSQLTKHLLTNQLANSDKNLRVMTSMVLSRFWLVQQLPHATAAPPSVSLTVPVVRWAMDRKINAAWRHLSPGQVMTKAASALSAQLLDRKRNTTHGSSVRRPRSAHKPFAVTAGGNCETQWEAFFAPPPLTGIKRISAADIW